jgi:hypothetical protein
MKKLEKMEANQEKRELRQAYVILAIVILGIIFYFVFLGFFVRPPTAIYPRP